MIEYQSYEPCQVAYVVAQQLADRSVPWPTAAREGWEVADAASRSEVQLSHGAPAGTVCWDDVICFASWYAQFDKAQRDAMRARMRDGYALWSRRLAIGPVLCDRSALDDPRFRPEPPCAPALGAVATAGLAFVCSIGAALLVRSALAEPKES